MNRSVVIVKELIVDRFSLILYKCFLHLLLCNSFPHFEIYEWLRGLPKVETGSGHLDCKKIFGVVLTV